MKSPREPERLHVVDGSGFIYRAYFAIARAGRPERGQPRSFTTAEGFPTGALYVFATMLMKLCLDSKPRRAVVVFDAEGGRGFRQELYPGYKARRRQTPDDLRPQLPLFPELARAFRLPVITVPGVEADDVIATLVRRARARGWAVELYSGDKDLMQLVGPQVRMIDAIREAELDEAAVEAKFGVPPAQVADVLALMGDASDDIPGVKGIGPGWAARLVRQYGDLEGVLAHAGEVKGKVGESLRRELDAARLSRRLVALKDDVALPGDGDGAADPLEALLAGDFDRERLIALFTKLEFARLLARLEQPRSFAVERAGYRTITTRAALDALAAELRAATEIGLDAQTTSPHAASAHLVGLAVAAPGAPPAYLPIGHRYLGAPAQLPEAEVLGALRPILEDPAIGKHAHDHKLDWIVLGRRGVTLRGVRCDPMLASYLLDPSRASHGLDVLAKEHLAHELIPYEDLCGRGKRGRSFEELEVERATTYAAENALCALALGPLLLRRVEAAGMRRLLEQVELPLAQILARMEQHGVLVDVDRLRGLGQGVGAELLRLAREVHALVGHEVNLGSPQQLQRLLFDELELPRGRMTKTGASTDAEVLEELAELHPVAAKILEWRELAKLKSGYIDALPAIVRDGRAHTSYNQAVTATGRLSSSDPNLQNIPIRTPLGRAIRGAFVAPPGQLLVSADYSQIELRILAHLAGDAVLLEAFATGEDVHLRTAREVFGVDAATVNADMRRVAKAVNFGVVYGQSDAGLARALGIPREQAATYIRSYFDRYAGVAAYMGRSIVEARRTGATTTLLGRRRPLDAINSRRWADRSYAERIARNTPIQGTAADVMKLAMIAVQRRLDEGAVPGARMVLTVHDELVFEVPAERAPAMSALARVEMEGVMTLDAPLKVDVGVGASWADAH